MDFFRRKERIPYFIRIAVSRKESKEFRGIPCHGFPHHSFNSLPLTRPLAQNGVQAGSETAWA